MNASVGLLLIALTASTPKAQGTAVQDPIERCVGRFPQLRRDDVFREKILPVWLDRRYHRHPEDGESVWSGLCRQGVGDGTVPTEVLLQREARATYVADREEFARRILDQIRPASGSLNDLQGQN